jgi:hypothetical protein
MAEPITKPTPPADPPTPPADPPADPPTPPADPPTPPADPPATPPANPPANQQELANALAKLREAERKNAEQQKAIEKERKEFRDFKSQYMTAEQLAAEERRNLEQREQQLKRAQIEASVTRKFALEGIAVEEDFNDIFPYLAADTIEDAERFASAFASLVRKREEAAEARAKEEMARKMPQFRGGGGGTSPPSEKGSFGAQVAATRLKSLGIDAAKK